MKTKKFELSPYPMLMIAKIVDHIEDDIAGRVCLMDAGLIIVEIEKTAPLEIVCHEAVHVVQKIAEYIGGNLDDETEAYYVAHVFSKLCSCINN